MHFFLPLLFIVCLMWASTIPLSLWILNNAREKGIRGCRFSLLLFFEHANPKNKKNRVAEWEQALAKKEANRKSPSFKTLISTWNGRKSSIKRVWEGRNIFRSVLNLIWFWYLSVVFNIRRWPLFCSFFRVVVVVVRVVFGAEGMVRRAQQTRAMRSYFLARGGGGGDFRSFHCR